MWFMLKRTRDMINLSCLTEAQIAPLRSCFPISLGKLRMDERLRAAGAVYYEWPTHGICVDPLPGEDEVFIRLVTSFATTAEDADTFLSHLKA